MNMQTAKEVHSKLFCRSVRSGGVFCKKKNVEYLKMIQICVTPKALKKRNYFNDISFARQCDERQHGPVVCAFLARRYDERQQGESGCIICAFFARRYDDASVLKEDQAKNLNIDR